MAGCTSDVVYLKLRDSNPHVGGPEIETEHAHCPVFLDYSYVHHGLAVLECALE
jgi:hypothetical protein